MVKLRDLGPLERWFLLMDRNRPAHFSNVVQVAGRVDPARVVTSLDAVQSRHPLLKTMIVQDVGDLFHFETIDAGVPLIQRERERPNQWHEELQREANTRVDPCLGPPLRVLLLLGDERSEFIFTIHHSAADGVALLLIIRDFFAGMAGQSLDPLPPPQSIERTRERMGAIDLPPAFPESEFEVHLPAVGYGDSAHEVQVATLRVTEAQTETMVAAVRRQKVTMHAALTAALVQAKASAMSHPLSSLRVFSPINVRRNHDLPHEVMAAVGAGAVRVAVAVAGTGGFWNVARTAMSNLAAFRTPESEFFVSGLLGILAEQPGTTAAQTAASFGYDLMLTNPGVVDFDLDAAELTVTDLWGPVVMFGLQDEQAVSALTFKGSLHLTLTSATPSENLLERAVKILLEQSS